ncbi:DUF5763 domain-containing protein [Pollutibacter soli]|uniref:DUF5763 domain-containing protein n=1 Tax=Pollutibacter soli TaxID=3034157 RepID=UPI003AF9B64D
MKLLLLLVFTLVGYLSDNTVDNKVLICKSTGAYAYHSHNCQGLRQCRATIEKVTIEEAKRLRRKACGYCYGNNIAGKNSSDDNDSGNSSLSQCRATTKKGTRCSRNAKSSGYCWQHE